MTNVTTTLSTKERLVQIEHELPEAEIRAKAEAAFARANHGMEMPQGWVGAGERLVMLRAEKRDLEMQLDGQRLANAMAELKALDQKIDRLMVQRRTADRVCAERAAHEAVVKFVNATKICMRMGWGYSWQIFREWYTSGRERYSGLHDAFFLDSDEAAAAGVQFDTGPERAAVQLWLQGKDASDRALMAWNTACEKKRALLREVPELQAAS